TYSFTKSAFPTAILRPSTPQDKLDNFNKFKEENTPAAFTGDGLNDAPVLSCADVGIAMGDIGSACAVEAA
ncbi:hypothetical protein JVV93_21635, partial [Vibrio cholerae O1]|nr:hypothetical protein [Vibrio cholerae O1]